MINEEDLPRINDDIMRKVLSHKNKEWNENVLTVESSAQNLFFSDLIFKE